jgi:hypothetical protein
MPAPAELVGRGAGSVGAAGPGLGLALALDPSAETKIR